MSCLTALPRSTGWMVNKTRFLHAALGCLTFESALPSGESLHGLEGQRTFSTGNRVVFIIGIAPKEMQTSINVATIRLNHILSTCSCDIASSLAIPHAISGRAGGGALQ
jgi:hypothetical protein